MENPKFFRLGIFYRAKYKITVEIRFHKIWTRADNFKLLAKNLTNTKTNPIEK